MEDLSEEKRIPAFEVLDTVVQDLKVRMDLEPVVITLTAGGVIYKTSRDHRSTNYRNSSVMANNASLSQTFYAYYLMTS